MAGGAALRQGSLKGINDDKVLNKSEICRFSGNYAFEVLRIYSHSSSKDLCRNDSPGGLLFHKRCDKQGEITL